MHYVRQPHDGRSSILVDFVRSGHDGSFVGTTSAPHLITADRKSIEQVSYASGAGHDWRMRAARTRQPLEAPHAYFFYLINNTSTYRIYEQNVITALPEGRAQLHSGDDFYYHRPILSGDTLAITATILPVTRKTGRHGDLTFFGDEWRIYNQENELAAVLVRKAAAIDFTRSSELEAPTDETMPVPEASEERRPWLRSVELRDAFRVGDFTHVTQHGPMTWMSMMGWLAAVDEYSPTHFDPDFAKAHRYGDGRNIVAGPQLAALMVAGLEGSLGPHWWIKSYENVQRRPVYPHDDLVSFSTVDSVDLDGAVIKLWLVDNSGVVKGTGTATIVPAGNGRKG